MKIQSSMLVTLKGKQARGVSSIEEAVKVCAAFRDTADFGFGIGATDYYRFGAGRVFVGDKRIAQIHYNGRVEENGTDQFRAAQLEHSRLASMERASGCYDE